MRIGTSLLWAAMSWTTLLAIPGCSRAPLDPNTASWRVLPGHVEAFSDPAFRSGRLCWVYLPPGYAWSQDRYPVLYATDGGAVFDAAMHVNRICEDMIRGGEIRPIIVVAIENGPGLRFWELAPWHDPFYDQGGGGEQFLQGIRDTLKTAIDREFRTLPDRANTAIAGVSLGGVFAAYAGIKYSGTFGNVAAFSPSYWLDGGKIYTLLDSVESAQPNVLVQHIRRYYQDTGTPDDNYITGMETALVEHGFSDGTNLMSVIVPEARHETSAWAHRYPAMLKFLFGR